MLRNWTLACVSSQRCTRSAARPLTARCGRSRARSGEALEPQRYFGRRTKNHPRERRMLPPMRDKVSSRLSTAGLLRRGVVALCMLIPAAALAQADKATGSGPPITPFSQAKPGSAYPSGWSPVKINDQKKPTAYDLIDDGGTVVLHAFADNAASLLGYRPTFDIRPVPVMSWKWKVAQLIASADNSVASKEDSPVRIVLEFDGDKSKLSLADRSTIAAGKILSGRELPYATLMYIWANKEPVGKIIPNPHTARVQMVVASSGPSSVGTWQSLSRNVFEDFRKAFGEDPGKLIGVAVLTDTDNTGEKAEAWYGDISFRSTP